MEERTDFQLLIQRVRDGDQDAASELVQRFGPQIRRVARFELAAARLRRILDSIDVWDSVLAAFFVRAASGQFEIETPTQLLALLGTMVRNRIRNHVEHEQAAKRDRRRLADVAVDVANPRSRDRTASRIVADRELLEEFFRRLPEEERTVAQRRATGASWKQISSELGSPPDTLRKRLARASDRVAQELGLVE